MESRLHRLQWQATEGTDRRMSDLEIRRVYLPDAQKVRGVVIVYCTGGPRGRPGHWNRNHVSLSLSRSNLVLN